ncbi:MAG: hypothetical protein R6U50_08310 [Desulfobacterales bacterium]
MTEIEGKEHYESLKAIFSEFRGRLERIYTEMDDRYHAVANVYGFTCGGCAESCCETLFYHHTHMEYVYLLEGFFSLDPDLQSRILQKAIACKRKRTESDHTAVRIMCPLNRDGLCLIYSHRPMICRLHGLPHELCRPGRPVSYAPGCDAFYRQCGDRAYAPFDRTPFYRQMAQVENDLRRSAGLYGKFKMDISAMLITIGSNRL